MTGEGLHVLAEAAPVVHEVQGNRGCPARHLMWSLTQGGSRTLIPSTLHARRSRAYSSTLNILHTFHQDPQNIIEGGTWSVFQAPTLSAKSRPAGTFLLRRLQSLTIFVALPGHLH